MFIALMKFRNLADLAFAEKVGVKMREEVCIPGIMI